MPTLRDLLNEAQDILESGDDIFLDDIQALQDTIYKKLVKLSDKFTTRGVLTKDKTTTSTLLKLRGELLKSIQGSKLASRVAKFIGLFSRLDSLNVDIHKQVNDIKIKGLDTKGIKKNYTDKISKNLLSPFGLQDGLLIPIQQTIFTNIIAGSSREKLIDELRNQVTGESGHIKRYVRGVAQDSLNQYDGQVQEVIKQEYNLNAYRYIGSLISNSRPQCIRWISLFDGIIPDEVLDSEVSWANKNGTGYSANLRPTRANFSQVRGGHNCRHRVISFRATEDQVKKAMIITGANVGADLGNIKHPSIGNQFKKIIKEAE